MALAGVKSHLFGFARCVIDERERERDGTGRETGRESGRWALLLYSRPCIDCIWKKFCIQNRIRLSTETSFKNGSEGSQFQCGRCLERRFLLPERVLLSSLWQSSNRGHLSNLAKREREGRKGELVQIKGSFLPFPAFWLHGMRTTPSPFIRRRRGPFLLWREGKADAGKGERKPFSAASQSNSRSFCLEQFSVVVVVFALRGRYIVPDHFGGRALEKRRKERKKSLFLGSFFPLPQYTQSLLPWCSTTCGIGRIHWL